MSWRLFWQIVALLTIGALILVILKWGLLGYKRAHRAKYFKEHSEMMEKGRRR